MTRKMRIGLPVVLLLSMAIGAKAQVIKGGICPQPEVVNSNYVLPGFRDSFTEKDPSLFSQQRMPLPVYSPVLLNATALGAGAVGSFPIYSNFFLRISIINLYSPLSSPFGAATYSSQGILMPVELGTRIPFLSSTLGTFGYTLYGETSAGLLFGWAFPTDGSFLNYSVPNSRFTTGASAYLGIGNSLRMDRYVGLYLNGGLGYFDLFSSSFMPQTRYLVPSVSVGFYFNLAQ